MTKALGKTFGKIKYLGILLLSLSFLASGCNPLKGTLNVLDELNLTSETKGGGFPPKQPRKVVKTLSAGNYTTEVVSYSKEKISLNVKDGKKRYKVSLNVPAGKSLPRGNGSFELKGTESGQTWNVFGDLETITRKGNLQRGREWGCSYYRNVQVCYSDNQGRTYCRWERRLTRGYEDVEFFLIDIHQKLKLDLTSPKDGHQLASFLGNRHDVEREYVYRSYCYGRN